MCLNEYHLFFLLSGAFIGYSYSLLYLINNMNYLPFPIIQVRDLNTFVERCLSETDQKSLDFFFFNMAVPAV